MGCESCLGIVLGIVPTVDGLEYSLQKNFKHLAKTHIRSAGLASSG